MSGFQITGTDHLGGGVEAILSAADELTAKLQLAQQQAQALREIRELHCKSPLYDEASDECHDNDHDVFESNDGVWLCTHAGPVGHACETCRDVDGDSLDYPCPTVATIERHGL